MTNDRDFLKKIYEINGTDYVGTILLDMDDVLAEFGEALIQVYNSKYNDTLTTEDMVTWDMIPYVKSECGQDIYELMKTPGLFRHLKPTPHAIGMVKRLVEQKYNVLIVSDAPRGHAHCDYEMDNQNISNPADDKKAWLHQHFPMIPQSNIFLGSMKYYIRGDVLIDDKPETYEKFTALGLKVLLMDKPYNRHIKSENRIYNLLEAEERIYNMFSKVRQ